jgi:hypothetical protein
MTMGPWTISTTFLHGQWGIAAEFNGGRSIVATTMNTTILRAREMSLALIVIAVVNHGHLEADLSGARPGSSGLMRLGRDLLRRAGAETAGQAGRISAEKG